MRTESLISKGKNEEFNQQYTFIETENNLNKKFISDLKNQIRTLESQILEYKVSTDNLRAVNYFFVFKLKLKLLRIF